MLTNNKKRSFVKLIALTLAALMVFSVCLTGCTDEDARLAAEAAKDAADKAQSSADAAQTAADGKTTTEAVAAQIAEALKPYLKADAALTEADVDKKVADLKAAIEASLKDYQAKGDYATKADVNKKQDKGDYATKTELTNAVKDALKPYLKASDALTAANVKSAIDTALAGYQVKGDYATKTEVTEAVKNALKGYATEAGVDAAIDAAVADFATKAEVTAALEAFASYAKSEDLADLSEKLTAAMGTALTADDVALIVKNAMADYEIDVKIAAAIAAQEEVTNTFVTDLIGETLAKYLTAEQIDARFAKAEQDLKDQVALLEQALADAKAELETLNGQTATDAEAALKAAVEALEEKLATAKADLETADAAAAEAAAADLKAAVEALEEKLAGAKAALEATDAAAAEALEAAVAALEEKLAGAKADLEAADATAAEALKAAVETLEQDMATAKTDLEAAIAATDKKIDDTKAELEAAVEALKKELAAAKTELDAAIKAADKKIDDTKAELEAQIAELEKWFVNYDGNPEKFVTLLNNVEKKMDAEQWGKSTVAVLRVLDKASLLINTVYGKAYTQTAKTEINNKVGTINGLQTGVVIFETVAHTVKDSNDRVVFSGSYLADANKNYLFTADDIDATGHYNVELRDATSRILSKLTVFILRAATEAEILGIEAALDDAIDTPTFEVEMNNWIKNDLYKIGSPFQVVDPTNNYANKKWNYGSNKNYRDTIVKDGLKQLWVAHADDADKLATAKTKLENLIVTYLLESMLFGGDAVSAQFGSYTNNLAALWYWETKDANNNVTGSGYEWDQPGKYFEEKTATMNVAALAGAQEKHPANGKSSWTFKGYFAGIDESAIPTGADKTATTYTNVKNANWKVTLPETLTAETWGEVMSGHYDADFLNPQIKVETSEEYESLNLVDATTSVAELLTKYTPGYNAENPANSTYIVPASITLQAMEQMIYDADYANDVASSLFAGKPAGADGLGNGDYADHKTLSQIQNSTEYNWSNYYLWHIGHNYVKLHNTKADGTGTYACTCSLLSDAEYLNKLTSYMIEQTESEPGEEVPADWSMPVWLTPVCDLERDATHGFNVAPWNYVNATTQAQAKTIDVWFNYAFNINNKTTTPTEYDAIERFELYEKLHRQAWSVLYDKYAAYANQVLNTMVNDFRVVAKTAADYTVAVDPTTYDINDAAFTLAANNNTAAEALRLYQNSNDVTKQWTDEFLAAYYNGTASGETWSWFVGSDTGYKKQIGPKFELSGLKQYYDYNGAAKVVTGVVPTDGAVKYDAVISNVINAIGLAQSKLDTMLVAAAVGPRKQIIEASVLYKNGMDDATWAINRGLRVQDAFDEILRGAMKNLEEIMNRFMWSEINNAFVNKTYAAVDQMDVKNGGHTYAEGVANFFALNDTGLSSGLETVLAQMMQYYVVGSNDAGKWNYSATTGSYDKQGFYVTEKTGANNTKFYEITYNNELTFDNDYMSVDVKPGVVYDKLMQNEITPAQEAEVDVIKYYATNAIEKAEDIYDEAINVMANMAVKYRYHDYIEQAKDSAYFTYLGYVAVATNYQDRLDLDDAYNFAAEDLAVSEFYAQREVYEQGGVMKYLEHFVQEVLAVSTAHTSPYYALMGESGSSYSAELCKSIDLVDKAFKKVSGVSKATELALVIADPDTYWTNAKKQEFFNEAYVADKDGGDADTNARTDVYEQYDGKVIFIIPQSPLNGAPLNNGQSGNNYFATGHAIQRYDAVVNN